MPDEPHVADEHTGITGAMVNVRIYQALHAREALNGKGVSSEDTPFRIP
ncbi:MAG: hypothetical protein ABIZ36_04270 [Gemmatimonadaceae bacterium]